MTAGHPPSSRVGSRAAAERLEAPTSGSEPPRLEHMLLVELGSEAQPACLFLCLA